MKVLFLYLLIINAVSFVIMLWDKICAKAGQWRIPEKTLMLIAAVGGSLGCYASMQLFRHKTQHPKFSIGVPILLCVHIVTLIVLNIIL